jgi:hypothetical protein
MHGAHKSKNVLYGAKHPQYINGEETKVARAERSKKSSLFLYLRDIGDSIGIFTGSHTKGRKPYGYEKLNLEDSAELEKAILAITEHKDS